MLASGGQFVKVKRKGSKGDDGVQSEHKKRKRRQRKDPELYGDGQLPTVSSRNEPSGNRMNYYARAFPDYGQPAYFCPPQGSRAYERTLRASSFYQPNSIDKAEI